MCKPELVIGTNSFEIHGDRIVNRAHGLEDQINYFFREQAMEHFDSDCINQVNPI